MNVEEKNQIQRDRIDVTIMLDAPCNYRCFYCCAGWGTGTRRHHTSVTDRHSMSQYIEFLDRFEAHEKVVRLNSYGELTLLPGIWDFIASLSGRAKTMLATNLTFDPQDLYRSLPPQSTLFILTSLHPETETHFDRFAAKCQDLASHGYQVIVHYMVNDQRIKSAGEYQAVMQDLNISFFLSPIQDQTDGRDLPYGFSEKTKAYLQARIEELHPQLLLRYQQLAFTGLPCRAGYDMFAIRGKAISPCMNSDQLLGWLDGAFEPLTAPSPCAAGHANSQCLPDEFLPHCRAYCMGDHTIESSADSLKPYLDRFAEVYDRVVKPAREAHQIQILQSLSATLARVHDPAFVALFGVPIWPYLDLLQRTIDIAGVILPGADGSFVQGYSVIQPDAYLHNKTGSEVLVVLYTIHGASQARDFLDHISQQDVIVFGDLPTGKIEECYEKLQFADK